jgi:hypothetical protein
VVDALPPPNSTSNAPEPIKAKGSTTRNMTVWITRLLKMGVKPGRSSGLEFLRPLSSMNWGVACCGGKNESREDMTELETNYFSSLFFTP